MRRRDFITLLGATAAWPLAAKAIGVTIPEAFLLRADEVIE
jgi:hypothetical protein